MQYLGYTYTKIICCLSEIQLELGILYFYLQNLATLCMYEQMNICIGKHRIMCV